MIHDHQQDQCPSSSVMIDSAEKLINGACDVLSDPIRREAYNMLMGYRLLRSRSLGKPYPILGQRFYYLISFCFFFLFKSVIVILGFEILALFGKD